MDQNGIESPFVSVIVPAHNEDHFIESCIASIYACGWLKEKMEIIVVDNLSTDCTANLALRSGARVVSQEKGRIGAIRNAGLKSAKGDFVAFVDGDCTVAQTWIQSAIDLLISDRQSGAIGGPCLSPTTGTWVERALASSYLSWSGTRRVERLATSSFIASKQLLVDIGYFNEELISGEDDDISKRIRERGLNLYSSSDCHVIHYGYPRSWLALLRKEIWHGSNQLEIRRSGIDLNIILVHCYLLGLVILPISLIAGIWDLDYCIRVLLSGPSLLLLFGPCYYTAKKVFIDRRSDLQLVRWFVLGMSYFMGRAIGLAQNYWRRLSQSTTYS